MEIGFAMCGSFCTFSQVFPVMEALTKQYNVTPIFSDAVHAIDSRFGTAEENRRIARQMLPFLEEPDGYIKEAAENVTASDDDKLKGAIALAFYPKKSNKILRFN